MTALEITGALFVICFGSLGHFIYDWSHHNPVAAEFFAVNESTWEHIKLCIYPSLIWFFVNLYAYYGNPNVVIAHTAGMLTMIFAIPFLFYGYTLFTHKSYLPVDISCFCISVCAGVLVFRLIVTAAPLDGVTGVVMTVLSVILLLGIVLSYLHLTYHPLQNFLFKDPITQRYGIAGHPCSHDHKHGKVGQRHVMHFHHEDDSRQSSDANIGFLREANKVFFVAMKEELDADALKSSVVYTGVGKARAGSALIKYIVDNQALFSSDQAPLIVSLGTAGGPKFKKGDIVCIQKFCNNGDSFIKETVEFDALPVDTGYVCASSDFFVGPENFTDNEINQMHSEFDCFDMESFALAKICKSLGLKFCAVKCISDGADANVSDFDAELPRFRAILTAFARTLEL